MVTALSVFCFLMGGYLVLRDNVVLNIMEARCHPYVESPEDAHSFICFLYLMLTCFLCIGLVKMSYLIILFAIIGFVCVIGWALLLIKVLRS